MPPPGPHLINSRRRYGLDLERTAKIWRGGCIIRSAILEDIRKAFDKEPDLVNLLLDKDYSEKIKECRDKARKVLNFAVNSGLPAAGLASAVSYFDAFKTGRLPMNLVQAQRDHFKVLQGDVGRERSISRRPAFPGWVHVDDDQQRRIHQPVLSRRLGAEKLLR